LRPFSAMLTLATVLVPVPVLAQEIGTGVRATVNTLFDSNLLRANRLRPARNRSDVRVTPAITINVDRERGPYRLYLKGEAGYDLHRQNTRLDSERIGLVGGGRARIGGFCHAEPSVRLDRRQVDVADLGLVERNRLNGQTYTITADCTKPAGISPVVSASYAHLTNSSLLRRPFDLDTRNVTAALAYVRPSLGRASVVYSYTALDRPTWSGLEAERNRTVVQQLGLRFEREVAARLHGTLEGFAIRTDTPAPGVDTRTGLGWHGLISWLPSPATTINAESTRDVRGDSSFGAAYLVYDSNSLSVVRRLGYRTSLEASAALTKRDLREEVIVLGLPLRGSDRTTSFRAVLRHELGTRINLAGEIGHLKRTASNPFYNFNSTQVALRAGLRF
jgi:hypothetical protein